MLNIIEQKNKFARIAVVVASFCMVFACLGFCSSNRSIYLSAITEALGIKRSLFSLSDSCRFIFVAIVNLFFGTLVQRFGARKLIGAGFLSLIVSTLIFAYAEDVTAFCIGGCLLGIGFSWTTTTMACYLVNRWFTENRGTMSGIILCANGLGGALAAQIVTPIIYEEGNPFGYRNAYLLVAGILLVVGIMVVLFVREPSGDAPENVGKKKIRGKSWAGIPFEEAIRKPYFYLAAIGVFLTGMIIHGITGVSGAHYSDVGLDKNYIATVLSVHSIVLCGSKFLAGFSYDKLGLRVSLLLCQFCGIIAFLTMAMAGTDAFGMGCAMVGSAMSSLALPLETVMVPLIAADLFGEKAFAKTVGIFVSVNSAGYAIGTPVFNLVYDLTGSYVTIFYAIVPVMLAVAVGFVFITKEADKVRAQQSADIMQ
jgi:MFS family permease